MDDHNTEKSTGVTCLGCKHQVNNLFSHFFGSRGQICKQKYSEEELLDAQNDSRNVKNKIFLKQYRKQNYTPDQKEKEDELLIKEFF